MVLFYTTTEEAAKLRKDFCRLHFPRRTGQALRFCRENDRLRSLAAGALLFGVLHLREEQLCRNAFGKPYAGTEGVSFNLSHSGTVIVLATDSRPLGVDAEQIDEQHLRVARKVYTREEYQWMQADAVPRFHRLWTLKESVMKAVGLGMALRPESFSVLPLTQGRPLLMENTLWYGASDMLEGHAVSICTQAPVDGLEFRFLNAAQLQADDE